MFEASVAYHSWGVGFGSTILQSPIKPRKSLLAIHSTTNAEEIVTTCDGVK